MDSNNLSSDSLLPGNGYSIHFQGSTQSVVSSGGVEPSQITQESSIPIRRSHSYSLLRATAHISSILVAVAILSLCFTNTYFSDITRSNINSILNALQFVARIHEFLVGASLTGVVLYHMRGFLSTGDGLPLGYVASAFQITSPQILWSREYWAASVKHSRSKRIYWFGSLLTLAVSIVALIGPSSAILIIPELDWWSLKDPFSETGGYSWIDGSYEGLWPTTVNASLIRVPCDPMFLGVDRECPYTDIREIQNWVSDYAGQSFPPNITITADSGMMAYLTASEGKQRSNGYAVASTGMSFLLRSMGGIWLYGEGEKLRYSEAGRPMITLMSDDLRPLLRPLVQVQCGQPYDISTVDQVNVTFNTSSLTFKEGDSVPTISRTINATDFRPDNKHVRFNWTDLSDDSTIVNLGAIFGVSFARSAQDLPWQIFPSVNGSDTRALFPCAVKAFWVPTTMARDPTSNNVIILDNPDPYDIVKNEDLMGKARDLHIDMSYAEYLNAPVPGLWYTNVIESELSRFNYAAPFFDGAANESWPWLLATTLSMQLADALSRISHTNTTWVWHAGRNASDTYAKNMGALKGTNNRIDNVSSTYLDCIKANATATSSSYVPVRWKFQRYGYAWGFERSTKILASIVLLAHVLLILAHSVVVWTKYRRFDSWERLVEFLALAMLSPAPRPLEGASVRIRDSGVFAEPLFVRESEDGRGAALVMRDRRKEVPRKRIAVGKMYR